MNERIVIFIIVMSVLLTMPIWASWQPRKNRTKDGSRANRKWVSHYYYKYR